MKPSIGQWPLFIVFYGLLSLGLTTKINAQSQKLLTGTISAAHDQEPVPFASVRFKGSGTGKIADSTGGFFFRLYFPRQDTLEITAVGFQDYLLPFDPKSFSGDTISLQIQLTPGKQTTEIVIRKKVNRGLLLWKRIVAHKPENDRRRFDNYSYELYNKIEFDLKNVNREKATKMGLLKPFNFIFDNIDTSEGYPYLPAYLTESISDYYYQGKPLKRREVFKGSKTIGIQNESFSKLMGGMDQNINVYKNYIPVFNQSFVSPIADNADEYYRYKIADTQIVSNRRIIHFLFFPLRKGERTFEGECWVHDTTYAVQKIYLRLAGETGLNYVSSLNIRQECQWLGDSIWFLSKDQFVADFNIVGKDALSVIGRKTTTYKNIRINDPVVETELSHNRQAEETIMPPVAASRPEEFWATSRHEQLNKNEQAIYHMMDTLLKSPTFKKYTRIIELIGNGCMDIGMFEIGPFYNWVSTSSVEGLRLRFDLATNTDFSKKIIFTGYAAYGTLDRRWKGRVKGKYLFNKSPRMYLLGYFSNDFDYGQEYLGEFISDNFFALAVRRKGIPVKFINLKEHRLDFFKEWRPGVSMLLSGKHKHYMPLKNLPDSSYFLVSKGRPLANFEMSLTGRFAYLEKFIENTFSRISLSSPYPIVEMKYSRGISGVGKSSYDYHKISGSINNHLKIPPFGKMEANLFAGKTYGTLPYMLLDVAPGNEMYYYNKFSFNMMNRFEFIHDRYAGLCIDHNIGSGLFRFIPFTRKLKFRQFWTAKAMWGSLSEENKTLNFVGDYPFKSLDGKSYVEVGTGIDNIFRLIRIDCIWRLPQPSIYSSSKPQFGVFGSLKLGF